MEGNLKIITMSEAEMLDLWKLRLNLYPALRDCVIEREDGIDMDAQLKLRIREWYARMLKDLPLEHLPKEDIKDRLKCLIKNGVMQVSLPNNFIAPISFQLESWERPVTKFWNADSFMAQLQYDELTRGGQENPIAIWIPNKVMLYSAVDGDDKLIQAYSAIMPQDGTYIMAEYMLDTIPNTMKD